MTRKNLNSLKNLLDRNGIIYIEAENEVLHIPTALNKPIFVWIDEEEDEYVISYNKRLIARSYDETLLEVVNRYLLNDLNKKIYSDSLLDKYGEYGIPYKEMKKTHWWNTWYDMELDEIREFVFHNKNGSDEALVMLTLGNFDIEFFSYGYREDGSIDTSFVCCARYENIGWQSEGFADIEVYEELFDAQDIFEEVMYNSMVRYMKEHNLKWSELNVYSHKDEVALDKEVEKVKEFNKIELLANLCKDYGYNLTINVDGTIVCSDDCDKSENNFKSIEEALIHWLDLLEYYNSEDIADGKEPTWKDEVAFIKTIEAKQIKSYVIVNGIKMQCNTIDDFLVLGNKYDIGEDDLIDRVNVEDKELQEILEDYIENYYVTVVDGMEEILESIEDNKNILIAILKENTIYHLEGCEYWLYEGDINYAISEHLQEVYEIPYKVLDYMDKQEFLVDGEGVGFIEAEEGTVIYKY